MISANKDLFIVEGESAASSIRQAIFSSSHDVFALQGKLVNAAHASKAKVFSNSVCQRLFNTLGCGTGPDCYPEQLKYKQILIVMDPDQDGSHIQALVLILFRCYLSALVSAGRVSIIRPPLYRLTDRDTHHDTYVWNHQDYSKLIRAHTHQQHVVISRLKHIGQFSTGECIQFFIDEKTRKQINLTE